MKGHPIPYGAEELAWIEERKDWPRRHLHSIFATLFDRRDVSLTCLNALCKRKGWMTGRDGCFEPGAAPHNKGKPCPPGRGGRHPNARKAHFGKGHLPHNTKWLGHERVSKDGYVELSIEQTNPHTGFARRYVLKHRHLWELANGPIPAGHVLKCLDGNKQNTDPANWEAVPRAILPRLAGGNRYAPKLAFDDAPAELRPTILAVANLEHCSRQRAKREAPGHEVGPARKGEHAVAKPDAQTKAA